MSKAKEIAELGDVLVVNNGDLTLSGAIAADVTGNLTGDVTGNITSTGISSFATVTTTGNTTVGGDLIVTGNLQVDGTTTTINSANLTVDDLNITVASGAANATAANGAGLTVDGANATITYDSVTDSWDLNKSVDIAGNLTVDTNTLFVDAANNRIGIGTNSPAHTVDIVGVTDPSIRIRATGASSGDDALLRMSVGNADASNYILFGDNADSDVGYIRYQHATDNLQIVVNAAERIRITNAGNVGIGTTTPATKFAVSDSGAGGVEIIPSGVIQSFNRSTAAYQTLNIDGETLTFRPNGTEAVRIASTGSVGIGTNSIIGTRVAVVTPGVDGANEVALHLATGDPSMSVGQEVQLNFGQGGNATFSLAQIGAAYTGGTFEGAMVFRTNAPGSSTALAERLRITSTGLVGINTSTPGAQLEVAGGSGVARIGQLQFRNSSGSFISNNDGLFMFPFSDGMFYQDHYDGGFVWRTGTSNTERMRIDSLGRVGIGTSSPGNKLVAADTNCIVQSLGTGGYGAFYATGSGTNASYMFFGNAGGEKGRITSEDSGVLVFSNTTGATERMRIDSSGRVGIGISSPAVRLHVSGASVPVFVNSTNSNLYKLGFQDAGSVVGYIGAGSGAEFTVASSVGTERMRIDSNGRTHFGGDFTTLLNGFGAEDVSKLFISGGSAQYVAINSNSANVPLYVSLSASASTSGLINFADSGVSVGLISTNGTSTSYGTSSDYRLKENVVPLAGAADRLAQIPVHRFNFIADPNTTVDGFLAHEVQAFVPEAITGTKDEVDADGNPAYQGIDQSKLVPLLTAALQEALNKIENLENRLNQAGL